MEKGTNVLESRYQVPFQRPYTTGVREYTVGNQKVGVTWVETKPTVEACHYPHMFTPGKKSAIIMQLGFPGTAEVANGRPVAFEFAQAAGVPVISVSMDAVNPKMDLMLPALQQFLAERGLEEVVLVGQSQGTLAMTKLATMLDQKEMVRGLVLMNPAGLYRQNALAFIWHTLRNIPIANRDRLRVHKKRTDLKMSQEFYESVILKNSAADTQEGMRSRKQQGYLLRKLITEFREIIGYNPAIQNIEAPVVGIWGAEDRMYPPEAVKITTVTASEQSKMLGTGSSIPQGTLTRRLRLQAMHKLFPKSPYTPAFVGKWYGSHNGLYMVRGRALALTSLGQLERFHREKIQFFPYNTVVKS